MRFNDRYRRLIDRQEQRAPAIQRICDLPPTLDENEYVRGKKKLFDFFSYYHGWMSEDGKLLSTPTPRTHLDIKTAFDTFNRKTPETLAVISEAARLRDPDLFQLLAVTGRETDLQFVKYLQEQYGEVPALTLAVRLVEHTYGLWKAFDAVHSERIDELNQQDLDRLCVNALEMARYSVPATHVTTESGGHGISLHGFIESSQWKEKEDTDYEGNGVYVGIFGAYRDWAFGQENRKIFEFPLHVADAFPILVSRGEKLAMANVLTKYVRVQPERFGEGVGVRQWWVRSDQAEMEMDKSGNYQLYDWQYNVLYERYGERLYIERDREVLPVVVIDTDEPPIILATIGKYLQLYRCLSQRNLNLIAEHEKDRHDFSD